MALGGNDIIDIIGAVGSSGVGVAVTHYVSNRRKEKEKLADALAEKEKRDASDLKQIVDVLRGQEADQWGRQKRPGMIEQLAENTKQTLHLAELVNGIQERLNAHLEHHGNGSGQAQS